ncbi:MAG: flagellar basal body-associated FliL family protein [Bacillota bacterium]
MSNEETNQKKPGARFWIILTLILLIIIGGTAAGVWFYLSKNQFDGEQEKELPTYKIPLSSFTVNLKDNNYKRYIRLEITLETNEKNLSKEVDKNNHRIRDVIITVLNGKVVADLEDRDALKAELVGAINDVLEKGLVSGIYFDQFMVQ